MTLVTSATTTTRPGETATSAVSTTTEADAEREAILVATPDGVLRIADSGTELVYDAGATAVRSDHRGGVVYQTSADEVTEIWWRPLDDQPRPIAVGSAGADVLLQDVSSGAHGEIWYIELVGDWGDDQPDSLVRVSLSSGRETERTVLEGIWGVEFHVGEDLVGRTSYRVESSEFAIEFFDLSMNPVTFSWNPYAEPSMDEDCRLCGVELAVSDDAAHVAWSVGLSLEVIEVATGATQVIPMPEEAREPRGPRCESGFLVG